ncbi:MAG TPA: retropepsin-like aspartic protease [Oleiagrimonas sp.]|nr:retropepsin-like aspartic protease [Oleiagrimonas sp.]
MAAPGAALAQSTPPASAPRLATPNVTRDTLVAIVHALREGDVPALANLYQYPPDPATRVLAAMALERIHFNLDKASEDARICEHGLIDSQPNIAFFCARFANGNLRLSGQEHAADIGELAIVQRFARKVPRFKLDAMRRYVEQRKKMPPLQIHRPSGTFLIPLGRKLHTDMVTIEIKANGTTLPLIVDTGSSGITVDAKWARKLGVRMTGQSGTANGLLSHDIHVRHGILDKLGFAGVTMEHVPVTVVPGKQRLIGIDVLRHLGNFRLGKNQITVYGSDTKLHSCHQPMLIGSDLWGNHVRLLTALPVDGTLRTMLVDSGTSFFLAASQDAMDELNLVRNQRIPLRDMGARKHHTRINLATVIVDISGQPFKISMPVFKDAHLPWNYIIGSGALRYMDFYFDFGHHHTCMLLHDDLH